MPIQVKYALCHSKLLKWWNNAYSEHKQTLFKHFYFHFSGVLGSRQERWFLKVIDFGFKEHPIQPILFGKTVDIPTNNSFNKGPFPI